MVSTIQALLPYLVVASDIAMVILFVSLILKNSFARWVGKHAVIFGFLAALAAVSGSLFYSNVVGFEPCVLCWWQRLFIYPQLILFLTALKFKDRSVFRYAWRLSFLAAVVAIYHQYVYMGGQSILPCTALGGACSKIYVMAFGYITIPMMSLTISLSILLFAWANHIRSNS